MLGPSLVPILILFVVFTAHLVFTTPSHSSTSEGKHFERLEGTESYFDNNDFTLIAMHFIF